MNLTSLRDIQESDLPVLYEQQLDPVATHMAAFPARNREAFMAHWAKIEADASTIAQTIVSHGRIAGNIVKWEQSDKHKVGYWLGKEYWGQGIASAALVLFLQHVKVRPLHAHVAKHNSASIRVLEKSGFTISGEDKYSGADGKECEEFILILGAEKSV